MSDRLSIFRFPTSPQRKQGKGIPCSRCGLLSPALEMTPHSRNRAGKSAFFQLAVSFLMLDSVIWDVLFRFRSGAFGFTVDSQHDFAHARVVDVHVHLVSEFAGKNYLQLAIKGVTRARRDLIGRLALRTEAAT